MRLFALGSRPAATLACAGVIASTGAAAFALTIVNSDAVISRGFERAFTALRTAPVVEPAKAKPYDGVAGTEEFWLRSRNNGQFIKAVAVGNEITLTGGGFERHMTITDVREMVEAETHITTSGVDPVLLLTCREGDEKTGHQIRLRIEAGRIVEVPANRMARTL